MARSLHKLACAAMTLDRPSCGAVTALDDGVVFRTLIDLATGDVAGIETAHGQMPWEEAVPWPRPFSGRGVVVPVPHFPPDSAEGAGNDGAYLVRAEITTSPLRIARALDVPASRVIVMYDVAILLLRPYAALEALVAGKRAGLRILLDNFDLEDPPVRFLEMAPADILRVSPALMPWHWDEARRLETMESLTAFAANLLMDVAVEGVVGGQCPHLKRLGVRYAQGRWRRDPFDRPASSGR